MTSCIHTFSRISKAAHGPSESALPRLFRWSGLVLLMLLTLLLCSGEAAVSQTPVSLGQTAVGQPAPAQPVTVTMTAAGTGAGTTAVTLGNTGLDFALAQGSGCAAIAYVPGQQCTVNVVFTPEFPGKRSGAVVVTGSNGQLLGSTLVSGYATGPLAVLANGDVATVAGNGELLYRGDGGQATSTPVYLPQGVVADALGNLYISDTNNNRIRRVDAKTGVITTFAGTGTAGYSGDGGAATLAQIAQPAGLVLDGAGNLFFADSGNDIIRRIDAVSGLISTVAGVPGKQGYAGDNGSALLAQLSGPRGITFDTAGDMYIADTANNVVRMVTAQGVITTVAGTGAAGYNGDGQQATAATLNTPWTVTLSPDGSLYIADLSNNLVRKVNAAGVISSVAGTGVRGFSGDGNSATTAALNDPAAIVFNPAGDMYIADSGNNRVRKVTTAGIITTLTGTDSEQFGGDGGPANLATLYAPYALFFDQGGNLFFSDMLHNRIRVIAASPVSLSYPDIRVSKTSAPQAQGLENDGNDNLVLGTPVFSNAALDSASTTCTFGSAIGSDTTCNLGVEFQPTVTGTPVPGSVTLPSNAGNAPTLINLSGNVLSVEPVTVTLTSSQNPSLLNASVTFTATVASDDPNVSGPVTFYDGTTAICSSIALSAGTATCTTTGLALGQHNITASYAGDANNEAKTSAVLVQTVQQTPAVALTATPNPANVGASVSLSVAVTAPSGTPTGTVILYDGTTAISGSLALTSGAVAFSTTTLTPGTHTLTAQYSGDTNDAAATSNSVSEVINQVATVTTISSSNANAYVGTAITLTATVSGGSSATGTVVFTDETDVLGTVTLGGNGQAVLTLSSLTPGTHHIVASYSGDKNNALSASAGLPEVIQQIPTVVTLSSSAASPSAGASVTLTANVAINGAVAADGAITGLVTFTTGTSTLGAVSVDANGNATLNVVLPAGTQNIVATYAGNANYAGNASSVLVERVSNTSTTTTLSGSATSSLAGKPVTFTAVVASSTGVPTGSVTFSDGANVLGASPLTQGTASFTTSGLSVASHTITATYSGDSNYLTSKSATVSDVVSLATTSISLTGPAKADVGTAVTLTGSLTTNGVTPTGAITLLDGTAAIATQNVGASGSFSFTTSALSIGTHTLSASYAGDSNNGSSASGALTLAVQQDGTTTSLASSVNPATVGQSITLTAGVTSDGAGLTGTVAFLDGGNTVGSAPLVNGTATLATSALTFGAHSLTAVYSGDTNHAASTSAAIGEQVVQAATATLIASANPATSGTNVVLTAHLAGVGSLVPTGSVIFRDGANTLATAVLDATGSATFQSSTLAVGTHALSVSYGGDTNYAAASAALTETIQNASTQVALTASANPAVYAAPLQLTATITSNGGIATGSVTFTEAGAAIGSAVLNANGVATLTISTLKPGAHAIVASYAGDGKAGASVSTPLSLTVLQTTTIAVTSSANPAQTLSPLVLTATVSNSLGQPTGTVTFTDGTTQLGSVAVGANGVATLSLQPLSAGTHTIVASYGGDAGDSASTSTLAEVVQLRPTTTSLTATQSNTSNQQQVTLIAVVRYTGSTAATGNVTFVSGSTTLGSSPVDATGVATLNVVLQSGSTSVTATYSGDTAYATSASGATAVTPGTPTQFTLTLDPNTLSVQSKQHVVANLTIASINGFTDTLNLGCLGLPFAATCTFSTTGSNTVSQMKLAADGTTSVQLTLDTGNPLGAGSTASAGMGAGRIWMITLPLSLLLGFVFFRGRGKRSRLPALLLLAFAAALSLTTTGCAGLQVNGTPAGTYTFYVTAAGQGTGATQSQAVTLTVTQ